MRGLRGKKGTYFALQTARPSQGSDEKNGGPAVFSKKWCPQLVLSCFILLHEKFLQFDWLRAVVFQLNLKYLHVKITNLVWVVV